MSYVEDAIYNFVKNIMTKGIIVLTNKRFLTYTLTAVITAILLTIYSFIAGSEASQVYNLLFKLEMAVCAALVITGLISLKLQLIKVEHLVFFTITIIMFLLSLNNSTIVDTIENAFLLISFYSWIITTNLAGLMAIREFVVSWPGWFLRLGDSDERIMFSPIIKIALFASIAWFLYSVWTSFSWSLLMAFIAAAILFYTIYIFLPVTKDGLLTSIISFHYIGILYHLFVRAESSSGFLIIDIIIIVASTIFTAQSISNLIASKKHSLPYQWDSMIIMLLGFMLGYHLLAVKIALTSGLTGLYSLYHDISFGFGTLIIFGILILYTIKPSARDFAKSKVSMMSAVDKASSTGLDALNKYLKGMKQSIKEKNWKIEIKKKGDDEQ